MRHKRREIVFRGVMILGIVTLSIIALAYSLWGRKMDTAVFETDLGSFEIKLDKENAPITTENFISYVESGFYDGLIFHRVMPGFMIQGGGFDQKMVQKKTNDPIKNEAKNGLSNVRYSVAMARTPEVDSATAQFFVNVVDNHFLDHRDDTLRGYGYAVFGKVVSGFDTIEKIRNVPTGNFSYHENVPLTPVVIKKAYMR